jgi:hypothetical protein
MLGQQFQLVARLYLALIHDAKVEARSLALQKQLYHVGSAKPPSLPI